MSSSSSSQDKFLVYNINNDSRLIGIPKGCALFQFGSSEITLISGQLSIDGHNLSPKKGYDVITLDWLPARVLSTSQKVVKLSNSSSVGKYLSNIHNISIPSDSISSLCDPQTIGAIALLKCLSNQEWLIDAEEFQASYLSTQVGQVVSTHVASTPSSSIATASYCRQIGREMFTVPISWKNSIVTVFNRLQSQSIDDDNVKLVFCGAKGAGKSSCLRYTINKLLSLCNEVCVIDCDVGQPELGIPGTMSLHVVNDPILAPSHLNLRVPELSLFAGDVTMKNSPSFFTDAVRMLYERYLSLVSKRVSSHKKRKQTHPSMTNVYQALTDADPQQEMLDRQQYLLPLLVNTDGYIRYMGSELLSSLLETVRPTHLFHLVTEKDAELVAVEAYLRQTGEMHSSNGADKHSVGHIRPSLEVMALDPGSTAPSKVVSSDLRTLR